MQRLLAWPTTLPSTLDGVVDAVAGQLGVTDIVSLDTLDDVGANRSEARDGLLVIVDAAVTDPTSAAAVVAAVGRLSEHHELDVVAIVGDGYLGTDHEVFGPAQAAAAVVATARSIATSRQATGRANVVAVPDALFGRAGEHRGPLNQPVEMVDVANAAAFFFSEQGGYLNGQVLFVDSGRHLFSSMTA